MNEVSRHYCVVTGSAGCLEEDPRRRAPRAALDALCMAVARVALVRRRIARVGRRGWGAGGGGVLAYRDSERDLREGNAGVDRACVRVCGRAGGRGDKQVERAEACADGVGL